MKLNCRQKKPRFEKLIIDHCSSDSAMLAHYSFVTRTIVPSFTGKWSLGFDGSPVSALSVRFYFKPLILNSQANCVTLRCLNLKPIRKRQYKLKGINVIKYVENNMTTLKSS
jgi:hypothetical protein